jgi:hypothetical protein
MLGVLGTGVGINLAGTYVLLTSERRVVVGTEAVAKGAEYDGALSSGASSPPPPRETETPGSLVRPAVLAPGRSARHARRERLSRDRTRDRNDPIVDA